MAETVSRKALQNLWRTIIREGEKIEKAVEWDGMVVKCPYKKDITKQRCRNNELLA